MSVLCMEWNEVENICMKVSKYGKKRRKEGIIDFYEIGQNLVINLFKAVGKDGELLTLYM